MEGGETEQRTEDEDERQHADEADRYTRRGFVAPTPAGVVGRSRIVGVELGLGVGGGGGLTIAQPLLDETGELRIDFTRLRAGRWARRAAGGHHAAPTTGSRSTARRRALFARALRANSSALAVCPPRHSSLTRARAPHWHGKRGGQVHPPVAAFAKTPLTTRSSPE